jgi:hypothetical protein
VHPVILPTKITSLALALKDTHGRYAADFNTR